MSNKRIIGIVLILLGIAAIASIAISWNNLGYFSKDNYGQRMFYNWEGTAMEIFLLAAGFISFGVGVVLSLMRGTATTRSSFTSTIEKTDTKEPIARKEITYTEPYPFSFVYQDTKVSHNNKVFIVNGVEFSSADKAKEHINSKT